MSDRSTAETAVSGPETPQNDAQAIAAALRSIPVATLTATLVGLLSATRSERKSHIVPHPDPNMPGKREDTLVELPDWPTRLRAVELVVNHRMGAPASKKPIEPPKGDSDTDRAPPGVLREGKGRGLLARREHCASNGGA